ncbi:MAG: DNA-3-methyladenine glycosylase [Sporolactobacillus laevolacticus]|jgi:DNA-3-methyladenine glycosylase II|nr:DNA-3-methyladenine glycosylase [Sporolactobacillus laevolacticus]
MAAAYIWDWFDFDCNLGEFYKFAARDKVLKPLINNFYGLRIMGIPDLFEALAWDITGQQINLTFAYALKKRFVYQYGESFTFKNESHWLFPSYETIASLDVEDLRALQFSVRKAEYIIGVAKTLAQGQWTRTALLTKQDDDEIRNLLISIRGIGAWTADLVMMRCLHRTNAFPIADVGLHNALKIHLGLERKPSIAEVKEMAAAWDGWYAYATFYLWRLLYEHHA